ncbi:MAG: flagellum-specific ATP synthase FliI, partial [Candidatus Hydrogenedens sp.]
MLTFKPYIDIVQGTKPFQICGKVKNITGLTIEVTGPEMRVGDLCYISSRDRKNLIPVEVVGFRNDHYLVMPLDEIQGLGPGYILIPTFQSRNVPVGDAFLGRVIDALGNPMDGKPFPKVSEKRSLYTCPP